jgi:Uma2 family endonuclease
MSPTTLITAEEFAQLSFAETEDYELVEGELVPLSSATPRHNRVKASLLKLLLIYFETHPIGDGIPEVDCLLNSDTVRRPDVSVFLSPRVEQIDQDVIPVPFAPDIAIEILSPSEGATQVNRKVRQYLNAGTQEVWLFDTVNAELFLHTPTSIRLLEGEAILETPLLPGFRSTISEILGAPAPQA